VVEKEGYSPPTRHRVPQESSSAAMTVEARIMKGVVVHEGYSAVEVSGEGSVVEVSLERVRRPSAAEDSPW
jgi:hypothetical protein